MPSCSDAATKYIRCSKKMGRHKKLKSHNKGKLIERDLRQRRARYSSKVDKVIQEAQKVVLYLEDGAPDIVAPLRRALEECDGNHKVNS